MSTSQTEVLVPDIHRHAAAGPAAGEGVHAPKGVVLGLVSGLVAISCCVSPVVLALIGVATAAEAVSLGNTLYYTYGWAFRGAGLLVAALAVILYLRRRRSCDLKGARRHRWMLLTVVLTGGATYAGLFWLTRYLGIWFG